MFFNNLILSTFPIPPNFLKIKIKEVFDTVNYQKKTGFYSVIPAMCLYNIQGENLV